MKATFVFVILQIFAHSVWAENGARGGDEIRERFILKGEEIIRAMENSPDGKQFINRFKIDTALLKSVLTPTRIQVVDSALTDNTGSDVDGYVLQKNLKLSKTAWKTKNWKDPITEGLVLHEIFRLTYSSSHKYNDEGFVISKNFSMPRGFNFKHDFEAWDNACSTGRDEKGNIIPWQAASHCYDLVQKNQSWFHSVVMGFKYDPTEANYNLDKAVVYLSRYFVVKDSQLKLQSIRSSVQQLDCSHPTGSCDTMIFDLADKVLLEMKKICLEEAIKRFSTYTVNFYESTLIIQSIAINSCVRTEFIEPHVNK